jgi:hypothetical protein
MWNRSIPTREVVIHSTLIDEVYGMPFLRLNFGPCLQAKFKKI